ncbi:uncharacterized protein TNCT_129651 [Trichonephila clavata]|uniref:Uncharacterized protein n=1 Tax=Trichonephila clavata TaxID=2740835 RepID=A0A8X6GR17_TRICU|nr:uncharacterized protein TNCT_129651 [Trichonephila clavata]
MHLDQKACENYYLSQVQSGGGPYFHGVSHQRGYGMFSNLFRFITPIAMKAGKHILSAGSKVMSDVASGSSLKDSARSRFREISKQIKDDFLHKIQSGSGIKRKRSYNKNHSQRVKRSRKKLKEDIFS